MDPFVRNASCLFCMSVTVLFSLIITYFVTDGNSSAMVVAICIMSAISASHMLCILMHCVKYGYARRIPQPAYNPQVSLVVPENIPQHQNQPIKEIEITMKPTDDVVVARASDSHEFSVVVIQNP